ncbi:MAG: TonB-dependent receptor [Myxococcales bacterium]|nr:TonB-dependent receptor [Myxococcales bacterium]
MIRTRLAAVCAASMLAAPALAQDAPAAPEATPALPAAPAAPDVPVAPTAVPAPPAAPSPPPPPPHPAAAPAAPADTLVVQADPLAESYAVAAPESGGKGEAIPVVELERRVDVVPKALMRDLGATTTEDVYRAVPNLVLTESGSFNLRGFGAGRGSMLIDGIHNSPYQVMAPFLVNVERVEVMKGPSGVLHGSGAPGGEINLVLEKPQAEDRYEFAAFFSSLGQRRVEVDATGALVGEDTLMYRVNLALEDSDTFRANTGINNALGTLGLTWKPHERVETTLQAMAVEDVRTGGRGYGYPILYGDPYFLPRETSINEPTDMRRNAFWWASLTTVVDLADALEAQLVLYATDFDYQSRYHEGQRNSENVNDRILNRQWRDQAVESDNMGYDLRLRSAFDLGPTHHDVLVGHDLTAYTNPLFPAIRNRISNPANADRPNGAAPIDLLAPDYGAAAEEAYTLTGDSNTTAERLNFGVYGTWRVSLFEDLHVMGGVRYDTYEETTDGINYLNGEETSTEDESASITGQAGLVYEVLSDTLSVYATWSTGFREQSWFSLTNPNGPFEPFFYTQYEAGVQGQLLDNRLIATASAFRIDRENELVPDPDPAAPQGAQVSQGVTRSEGIEVTIAGRPFDGWDITAQLGLLDARILQSTGDNKDDPIAQVPNITAGLWLGHDLGRLPLRLFGGFTYVGEQPTHSDDSNPLATTMPDYVVFDVGGRFNVGGWSAQLNFFNVLDEEYFTHYRAPAHSLTPGEPRGLRLVLSATF